MSRASKAPFDQRVARRSLLFAALYARAMRESQADAPAEVSRLAAWAEASGLDSEAEPAETELLNTPVGGLADRQVLNMSWLLESASMLGWSLGPVPLQEYDNVAFEDEVLDGLGCLQVVNVATRPIALRPDGELESMRSAYEFLLWRLRAFDLDGVRREDLFLEDSPLNLRFRKGDVLFGGKYLTQLSKRAVRELFSIVQERYQAISWVVLEVPRYSETPLDT